MSNHISQFPILFSIRSRKIPNIKMASSSITFSSSSSPPLLKNSTTHKHHSRISFSISSNPRARTKPSLCSSAPSTSFPKQFPKVSRGPAIRNTKKKKKFVDRGEVQLLAPSVIETLDEKIKFKKWEDALEAFEMLKLQTFYYPKESTYKKLLVLLGKCGQASHAQKLFDQMIQEGIAPTSLLYTNLLTAYCRSNQHEDAISILAKMNALPECKPDEYTYNILLKSCTKASRFDLVNSLYQDMSNNKIGPNTEVQNTILEGYGKAGLFNEMEKLLTLMLESNTCRPNVSTMNIILVLYGSSGNIDMMEKWYEKFLGIRIVPETRTFNILIGAYGKKMLYDKMSSVMEYMRESDVSWTTSTFNAVIKAFAEVGDAKNMEYAFNQMREEGMKADIKTFCCLIDGYSNAGQFDKVVSCIQLSERMEVPYKTCFYNSVIAACAKAGDLIEMEGVFTRMKNMNCAPDSTTYLVMMEAYKNGGKRDKVFELKREAQRTFGLALVD